MGRRKSRLARFLSQFYLRADFGRLISNNGCSTPYRLPGLNGDLKIHNLALHPAGILAPIRVQKWG